MKLIVGPTRGRLPHCKLYHTPFLTILSYKKNLICPHLHPSTPVTLLHTWSVHQDSYGWTINDTRSPGLYVGTTVPPPPPHVPDSLGEDSCMPSTDRQRRNQQSTSPAPTNSLVQAGNKIVVAWKGVFSHRHLIGRRT